MNTPLSVISLVLFCVLGLSVGLFLMIKPGLAIEIQKKFYSGINWRIEPISIKKELRNTRVMGAFLLVILIAVLVFAFIK